jgi:hypothetical protein
MLRWTGLFILIAFTGVLASATECPEVASAGVPELVQYLKTKSSTADPTCVAQAITRLGNFRSILGVQVLVSLLDYRRPESEKERYHLYDAHDIFPAVPALVSIGEPAVPGLIAKLQTGDMSRVARSNGIRAIVFIYSANQLRAITILRKAAANAPNQEAAARLESCARDAIAFCGEKWRVKCEEALK